MTTDLSQYRFTSNSELQPFMEKMGEREFYNYAIAVYERLFSMQPGEMFDITKKVVKENWDMFVKIACCYIIDTQTFTRFNDTFTIITRYNEPIKVDNAGKGVRPKPYGENDI